jgi:hypothetical protein
MVEDHHITRLEKGAMANFEVDGDSNPEVFEHVESTSSTRPDEP